VNPTWRLEQEDLGSTLSTKILRSEKFSGKNQKKFKPPFLSERREKLFSLCFSSASLLEV
jgi:hypothetical protein